MNISKLTTLVLLLVMGILVACSSEPASDNALRIITVEDVKLTLNEKGTLVATVQGVFLNNCVVLDSLAPEADAGNWTIDINGRIEDGDCSDEEVPFEEVVELDVSGLPAGSYTVTIDGISAPYTLDEGSSVADGLEPTSDDALRIIAVEGVALYQNEKGALTATVQGVFANDCVVLDSLAPEADAGNWTIYINGSMEGKDCSSEAVPFEEVVELDVSGLPAGTYIVKIDGISKEYTLHEVDTVEDGLEPTSSGQDFPLPITVEALEVALNDSESELLVTVQGTLGNDCVILNDLFAQEDFGNWAIYISGGWEDDDTTCADNQTPFSQQVTLDVSNLEAGTYTVTIQDISQEYTIGSN